MHVADAHQSGNVWLVRLSGQRVSKEENRVDSSLDDSAADDQVAAVGAVSDSFDVEAEVFAQQLPCVASRDEFLMTEEVDVRANELQHQGFLLIVSNECDHEFLVGHVFNVPGEAGHVEKVPHVRRPGLVSAERI